MLEWADNIRYYFKSNELGDKEIPAPINYEDGNGNIYERDTKSKGVLRTRSNTLEFFGAAYDYLLTINALYGIRPNVRVQTWAKSDNRIDERWRLVSESGVDLSSMEFDHTKKVVKAQYFNGGLYEKINARLSDEYDLKVTESVDGTDIGPLQTVNVNILGRKIFLESQISIEEGKRVESSVTGNDKDNARACPFQIVTNPDGEQINNDRDNLYSITNNQLNYNNGDFASVVHPGAIQYLRADRQRTLILNGRLHFKVYRTEAGYLRYGVLTYQNGSDLDFKSFDEFGQVNTFTEVVVDHTFNNYQITVQEGESWSIGYHSHTDDVIGVEYLDGNHLTITEDSSAPPTTTKAVTTATLFDRLIARATGQSGLFKSEAFGTGGKYENILKTNGFYVRQFPDVLDDGREIPFKTSIKKQLEAYEAVLEPLAWWTEIDGDREVFRLEPKSYTQQNFIGARYATQRNDGSYESIPVSNIKRKVLGDNYYSSIRIGSSSSGSNYEFFYGLKAFNGEAQWNTINDTKDVAYSFITPDRTGDIDVEILRRKPYDTYPDQDMDMDDDLIFLDCKKNARHYILKTWQDTYESAPENIYDPDSAFNLEFSPGRILLRHGYNILPGLYHYPNENIRLASSNCNTNLITKKAGEDALNATEPIPHNRMGKARFQPMSVDFVVPVPLEVEEQLNGITSDGVPNWFGLIEVNTGDVVEYLRLVKVDTNKEGKHLMVET